MAFRFLSFVATIALLVFVIILIMRNINDKIDELEDL